MLWYYHDIFVHQYAIQRHFHDAYAHFFLFLSSRLFTSTISEDTKGFIEGLMKLHALTKDTIWATQYGLKVLMKPSVRESSTSPPQTGRTAERIWYLIISTP